MFPQYIKDAVIASAKYHEKARAKQKIIEEWIEDNYGEEAINHDGIRDTLIDCVEQCNNPETAIKRIRSILENEI